MRFTSCHAGDTLYLQPAEDELPLYVAELLGMTEDVRGGMWADVRCASAGKRVHQLNNRRHACRTTTAQYPPAFEVRLCWKQSTDLVIE